ncbi:hypothetical protein EC973_000285 [Apophysomyces ossiformis]|uniref:Uncharacterized protein n=1 Tax=Apophysomyces ossiformis TaxID=679940 RepID=A0A8H7EPC3_9FUNG|nr:hypothetical protein EC973_000285 [Apophysomyces ossiformis]
MAFDATIYQNAAEVITLAILNILCSILAGLQVANGKRWHKTLGELAVQYHYTFSLKPIENAISVEIASTVLLGISAISFAYLSYVVVREFGWVIYKKIGADVAMQRMYRTFQFFVLALKIDTFLEFLISGFYVLQVIVDSLESFEWIKEWDTWIELVVTVMVLPMLYFGRMATTAILGFLCMRNFNQGLAPHVQRGSKKKKHTDHLALSKHTSNSSWKIDDDEDD